LKIDLFFIVIKSEAMSAIAGINRGNIIRLFSVGKISLLKFPSQFLSL
jgi:hypothetical protein